MSPSASQIEREVEVSRAHVEETVEALRDKMSVGQMVDEASRYFDMSGGPQMLSTFGAQIRANPLPLALVGIGLAWLMSGRGQPHVSRSYWDHYDPDAEAEHDGRGYYAGRQGYAEAYDGGEAWDDRMGMRGVSEAGDADEGPSIAEKLAGYGEGARQTMHDVQDAAVRTASEVGGAASSVTSALGSAADSIGTAAESVARSARAAGNSVADRAAAARRQASRAYRGASRFGNEGYDVATRLSGQTRRQVAAVIDTEPLVLGAVGLAIGAAIGALLPRTETEDRYLGGPGDRMRDEAASFAREKLAQGKAVVRDVYEAAKSETSALGVGLEGDGSLGERLGEVAQTVASRVRESAEKHGLTDLPGVESKDKDKPGQV